MRLRQLLVASSFALLLVVRAAPAHADPSLADRESARSLMDDGDARRDRGDLEGALRSYVAADALMHVPTTGLEVARTQAALGRLLEARETLAALLRLPVKPKEPTPFTVARAAAETLSAELPARIPTLSLATTGSPPAALVAVTVDGDVIPPEALAAPRRVDPGAHVVVARAGDVEKREDVTLAEGEVRHVTLDLAPPPVATAPRPSPLPKALALGGFGLAVVGVGVGTVTGLMSLSRTNDVKNDCVGNVCPPSRADDLDAARTLGTVSTVAFIAAGAGVAAGLVGLLLSRPAKITPVVGLDVTGARLTFP